MSGEWTIVGCGFAAKYPEGGGNFSVPLQYVLGLRRMGRRSLWLELLPSTGDPAKDRRNIATFRRRLSKFGLEKDYCILLAPPGVSAPTLEQVQFFGRTRRQFLDMVAGPCTLLNLSYSFKDPLLALFSCRKLCSLDPTEICFWMRQMDMGQHSHHEFWSIGLNTYGPDSKVPDAPVRWQTYFPLVDTATFAVAPRPLLDRFTTIGQWYWDGMVQWEGEWRDFSKKAAFEKFHDLPTACPKISFEAAMNFAHGDGEAERLHGLGWRTAVPHDIAATPQKYYRYIAGSTGEFSPVKLEGYAKSGWLSDRSAVYLAMGRPILTEPTGAEPYLPKQSGYFFVSSLEEAGEAARQATLDWQLHSRHARACACSCFDSVVNLKKMLA